MAYFTPKRGTSNKPKVLQQSPKLKQSIETNRIRTALCAQTDLGALKLKHTVRRVVELCLLCVRLVAFLMDAVWGRNANPLSKDTQTVVVIVVVGNVIANFRNGG